ncbi:transmembrane amino acid transporter protein-domain-containing protein [Lasiosphaeria miniovina]|uniref:Transmembrane amino acid transporter protein-domain-containing protein n=1 Tax=Lasiosphaeria miniovina TaxID=1954250 RepID=A0AA39ZUT1_9PEZI|nr:transmembrane amino acid transporter protein-domain-containing protein [Lasiosphaeria miniovina]KAK0703962.1 transmembrane amino acid transporter protein-domain-containing protein [Lasiosphaeria miniovina]
MPAWFGGSHVVVGPRIGRVLDSAFEGGSDTEENSSAAVILDKQIALEHGHAIQYRTCSWQKTAALLFSEYICLAIMSFPWSYSVLGLVPGLILTFVVAIIVLYTSLVLWEFCLRHPEVRDVCDIGQMLFWNKTWAWYATAVMFLLNNTALHVLVGAKYLNTMTDADDNVACRTVSFSIVVTLLCWVCSLPRTFSMLSKIGTASAIFTFVSVLLATVFAGVQTHPAGYDLLAIGDPVVTALPVVSTTFVAGMNAFLNISYTFIGQITLPSFIAEMKDPRDFPKALWACTAAEMAVFSVVGAVVYAYTGNQYVTAPAFGSLADGVHKKVAFSFMVPTLVFLGVLYASVSARFVFFRLFRNTPRHKNEHTLVGWAAWAAILFATWILAFIIAEVIPFFSSLLSLMSSLFDSFFGFIFWGVAYFRMRTADGRMAFVKDRSVSGYLLGAVNVLIILTGVFFLTVGSYASVEGIIDEFRAGTVGSTFTCKTNGL